MKIQEIKTILDMQFPDAIVGDDLETMSPYIICEVAKWHDVANFCKIDENLLFDSLMSLSATDMGEMIEVIIHLHSFKHNHKIALKTNVKKDDEKIATVSDLWATADWHEREAYDLLGIVFENHPNLTRILLPDDWEGFPLRKDYIPQETYHGMPVPKVKE